MTPALAAWMQSTAELFAADAEHPTADTRDNLGIAYLYGGYSGAALKQFESAVLEAPDNGRFWSDLTAAQLAFAAETESYEYLFSAAESAGQAMQTSPMMPEVLFNRALALESLHLTNQALHAWDLYLKLEVAPAWIAEALAHRAALSAPNEAARWEKIRPEIFELIRKGDRDGVKAIVEQFPGLALSYARDELFPEWAKAVVAHNAAQAGRVRAACRIIAATLKDILNDQFLMDAMEAIANAGESVEPLAQAHLMLRDGQSLYNKNDMYPARLKFEQARAVFASTGDKAFETYAIICTASCDFHHYRYQETLRALREVRETAGSRAYQNLLARTWWIEGTVRLKTGDPRSAVDAYQIAAPIYLESKDWEAHSHVSIGRADALNILGQTRDAQEHWIKGLKSLSRVKSPYRKVFLLFNISDSLAKNRRIRLALDFIEEAVETAVAAQDARVIPSAHILRASLYREVGKVAAARDDLAQARIYAERCPDQILREEMLVHMLLCQGAIDLKDDPKRALISLDRACTLLESSGVRYRFEEAHLLRAQARRKLGDIDGAEQDLQAAISALESDNQSFGYSHSLIRFDDPESVYNEMVSLQLDDRGRQDLAFRHTDAARSPKLNYDVIPYGQTPRAATLEDIQQNIPSGVTLVEYTSLVDRLLIWVIQSGSATVIKQPVANSELMATVKSLRNRIEEASSVADTLAEAARLYDLLIRPVEASIPETDRVVIVPSGPLRGLPFALLYDTQSRRYLVQAHALSLAPSAHFYLYSTRRAKLFAGGPPTSALLIGNPRHDKTSQPELTSLPGAEAEASLIAGIYPKSLPLLGSEATKERFLLEAGKYQVIHFAGHAIANDMPELAALTFAPNGQGAGGEARLVARELTGNKFEQTRLVVLAGCRTGQVSRFRTEGVAGLVRPFLAAGIPGVIAALWDVDDTATLSLTTALHRKLRDGVPPAEALRWAQISLIESQNAKLRAPWMWAAFQIIGNG